MSGPTSEAGVVGSICRAILREHPTAVIYKIHGGPYQEAGIPDLLVCVRGRFVGLEVKFQRPGESREGALSRATPGQQAQIAKIIRAGGAAAVVLNAREALAVIDGWLT